MSKAKKMLPRVQVCAGLNTLEHFECLIIKYLTF
jgi:hypothetical protein